MNNPSHSLGKEERVKSKKLIEKLFTGGGSHSLSAFPLRLVYMTLDNTEGESMGHPDLQMMVSVSKRKFKHAVKRNRVKRQVREAYRLNKHLLADYIPEGKSLIVGFIWLDNQLYDSKHVENRMINLLKRIGEKL